MVVYNSDDELRIRRFGLEIRDREVERTVLMFGFRFRALTLPAMSSSAAVAWLADQDYRGNV